jgi:ribonuclease G
MAKELIISANVHEKKVAILEDGVVTEFYVERRDENQGVVGNLYKGRVMKVLPGMQSAFVDIGLERDAFLYVSDFTEFMEEEDEIDFREAGAEHRPPRADERTRRERPQRPPVSPKTISEPTLLEERPEAVRIDDAVEHVAEIAVEKVIPPPPPDEGPIELRPETEEPAVASVDEFDFVRAGEASTSILEPIEIPTVAPAADAALEGPLSDEESERKPRRGRAKRAADDLEKKRSPKRGASRKTARSRRGTQEEEGSVDASRMPIEVESSGPQFERITDEDAAQEPGELLKDAIVQERIIEEIHNAEYTTEAPPTKPEPEWRVGSYRSTPDTSGFQRIVDEAVESSREKPVAPEPDAQTEGSSGEDNQGSAFRHVSGVVSAFYNRFRARSSDETSDKTDVETTADQFPAPGSDESEPAELDSPEAQAEVRDHRSRAEFAVRRGGRGRRGRRRPESQQPASPSTTETESIESPSEPDASTQAAGGTQASTGETPSSATSEEAVPAVAESGRPTGSRPRFDRRPEQQRRSDSMSRRRPDRTTSPTISELLHEGQEILVQIAKEPIAKKGARITSHIALPGRYLVYMPTVNHVGVSRKIPSESERARLKRTVGGLRERESAAGGFIARTACAGHTEQELHDDMRYLIRTWADIRKKAERMKSPALVHRDLDLVQRILRDQLSDEFTAIRIDNEIEYARIVEFVNRVQPKLVKRVKLHVGNQPILEKYGVQPEIDKAVRPRVWLKSGGYIVINQTEALVAIDVNTGKFVGKSDKLEDTITRTNLEAGKEIVRQVRLRDLGGIIVIDFIDMEERKNRQKVMMALQQELSHDRAPSKILSINDFGLVAITRKRVKQSLERTLCTPCPYCQGAGMVKSSQTMCFEILDQAKAISKQSVGNNDVMLRVSPHVAEALRTTESEVMEEIEAYFGTPVTIEPDPNLHQEQFDFAII